MDCILIIVNKYLQICRTRHSIMELIEICCSKSLINLKVTCHFARLKFIGALFKKLLPCQMQFRSSKNVQRSVKYF